MTARERKLSLLLASVAGLLLLGFGLVRIFGGELGTPCADSWACRRFLTGGECVQVEEGEAYCTLYCSSDAGCPAGWRCRDAHPTALGVQTSAVDRVCVR